MDVGGGEVLAAPMGGGHGGDSGQVQCPPNSNVAIGALSQVVNT